MNRPTFRDRISKFFSTITAPNKLIPSIESPLVERPGQKPYPLVTWSDPYAAMVEKQLHPYYGVVSGVYYAMTGMPWLSSDARKAVKTEWFWQPIRGQPRRVDTNELRKYANTIWVQSIVMTILNQVANIPWDIIPKDEETSYESAQDEIEQIKQFFEHPNKNNDSWTDILKAFIKDVLEIDAGVLVKVYTIDSYDFEHLEPRSGAPLLKPLVCPECMGKRSVLPGAAKDKACRTIDAMEKSELMLPNEYSHPFLKDVKYELTKPDYTVMREKMLQVVSYNSPFDSTAVEIECPFCNGTGTGRQLTEVYCQDGASFLKDADRTGWVYGYWQYSYAIPAHPMWFSPDEIVYYMANPRGISVYGYSPLQSSLEAVKALEYSMKHNMALFLDGAVPDGVVGVEDMSNEELTRMKTAWENELKGQPHKVVFVNKKTTFSPFAFNNRDMQFLEGQKETWKQVMANFNVTPADLGIFEDMNRATAGTAAETGRRKAIRPVLAKIEDMVNKQILPELGATMVKYQFIVDDPTEERLKAELSEIYIRAGIKSVNEIRIDMGLPPVEGGDLTDRGILGMLRPGQFGAQSEVETTGEAEGILDTAEQEQHSPMDATSGTKKKFEKDYQYPFQSQVPFITTIQNLSTPLPFALPKKGHPNTQYPYNEMNALCPGCGSQTLMPVGETPGGISVNRWHQCQSCHRSFTEEQLIDAGKEQERMHQHGEETDAFARAKPVMHEIGDVLAPKPVREIQMHPTSPMPNLVSTPRQIAEVPIMDFRTGKWRPKKTEVELKKKVNIKNTFLEVLATPSLDEWIGFDSAPLFLFVEQFLEGYTFDQVKAGVKRRQALRDTFIDAFYSGMNMHQLAGEIQSIGFDKDRAESIARTESIRIANEAKLLQAENKGFNKVQFTATLDNLTCEKCKALDGKIMSVKTAKGLIPRHPRCRCTWRVMVL